MDRAIDLRGVDAILRDARDGAGLEPWSEGLVRPLLPSAERATSDLEQARGVVRKLPARLVVVDGLDRTPWAELIDDVRIFVVCSVWKTWGLLQHSARAWNPEPPHSFDSIAAVVDVRGAAEEAGRFHRSAMVLGEHLREGRLEAARELLAIALDSQSTETGLGKKYSKTTLVDDLTSLNGGPRVSLYNYLSKLAHPQGGSLDVFRASRWVGASSIALRHSATHLTSPCIGWLAGMSAASTGIVAGWGTLEHALLDAIATYEISLQDCAVQAPDESVFENPPRPGSPIKSWVDGVWFGWAPISG